MLPPKFESVEILPHEPPFSKALVEDLGLRGINCGCGRRLVPGWMNTDLQHLRAKDGTATAPGRLARAEGPLHYLEFDATKPYPFEDGSFEWAHAEHFVEHLALEDAITWLTEIRRLLKPGGQVRLSTPDLRLYAEGYLDPENGFFAERHRRLSGLQGLFFPDGVPERPAWIVNQIFFKWGHRWIFDFEEIRFAAEQAGFDPAGVTQRSFGEGSVAEVAAMDIPSRDDESIYVELAAA